ncbi:MAG TPA: tetratricopeptide repeat protein, partial [candidate division Zixibacteria bacterium]|nr:tetratricopeptide repeat protein [candidate division Zixibacteria bacterium]
AWAHFYQGDLKLALNCAQKAIGYKNDYLDPLLLLGHIYSKSQDFDKAKEAYLNYIKIQCLYDPTSEKDNLILVNPDSRATAYYGLGIISEIKGDIKEARKNYLKVQELNPDYLDIQKRLVALNERDTISNLGLSLGHKKLNSGDFEEAERLFLKAYEESTDKRNVVLESAQLFLDKEQYGRAIKLYNLWLNSAGDDAEVLNDLGNCYFRMKQHEKALEYYEKASQLITAPIIVYRNLGQTCSILKQYGKAIISFRKYLSEKSEDLEINSILADLCLKVGDFKTAMPLYEKTLRANPTDYNAIFNLSECYLNMGHEDSARIGYHRVLELNADFEPAKKRLTQLEEVSTTLSQ